MRTYLRETILAAGVLLGSAGAVRAQVGYPAPSAPPGAMPTAYLGDPGYYASPPAPNPTRSFGQAQPGFGLATPPDQLQSGAGLPAGAPVVSLPVTPLRLSDGPGTVDVQVTGAPAFRGFELVVTFDPTLVALTGVSPGDMLTAAGGTLQPLGPILDTPGTVRYGVTLADTTAWPQGAGVLMRLTFAPLAQGPPAPLRIAEAALVDTTSQRLNATTRDGAIMVVGAPPPAAQTQAVASATALALATPAAGGSAGGLGAGLGGVGAQLGSHAPLLGWLAALGLGLAVAIAGWALGRR
jgi:hypothetical protein